MTRILLAAMLFTTAGAPALATVRVATSDTLSPFVRRCAEDFQGKNPAVRLRITEGDSSAALATLIAGKTDIAASSRKLNEAESARLLERYNSAGAEIPIALDAVHFIVNTSNPVDALTEAQLRAIFAGELTRWNQVGGPDLPIDLYSLPSTSGTNAFLKERLLKGEDFSAAAPTLPRASAVAKVVSQDPGGIGYASGAVLRGVKVLAVRVGYADIKPSAESVTSGSYPFARPLYFYLRREPEGEARAIIDHCLSPERQAFATRLGYFPLPRP